MPGKLAQERRAAAMALGGAGLVVVGAYLPWATFVLNDGRSPSRCTSHPG